jgi:DNA-binding CsgD family transcriptional regulator
MGARGQTLPADRQNDGRQGIRKDAQQTRLGIIGKARVGDGRLPRLFSEAQWGRLTAHFGLTARQSEIARLICQAQTYDAIARRAGISINTVRMHIRNLFDKLDAHDRVSVVIRLITAERLLSAGRRWKPA